MRASNLDHVVFLVNLFVRAYVTQVVIRALRALVTIADDGTLAAIASNTWMDGVLLRCLLRFLRLRFNVDFHHAT